MQPCDLPEHAVVRCVLPLLMAALLAPPLTTPAHAWPCAVRLRAYRDALMWTPRLLRLLVDRWGPDPRPVLCARSPYGDPGPSQDRPLAFLQRWDREIPRRMYRNRDLAAYLAFLPRSARVLLETVDPGRYIPDRVQARAFYAYTLRMLPVIPRVFYGYPDPLLDQGQLAAWLERADGRARSWAQRLRHPTRFGFPLAAPQWRELDHRTPAYAMAALSLQHGVTYIVRYWLRIWRQGHGTMKGLPIPWDAGVYVMRRGPSRTPRGR